MVANSGSRKAPRRAAVIALLGVAAIVSAVISRGRPTHEVFIRVPDATNVVAGQEIRASGQVVGHVAAVEPAERGRSARLGLQLDDTAWPLRQGTALTLRWGGTINFDDRYIALRPGPAGSLPFRDGATLPHTAYSSPVEFDQLFDTLTPGVRTATKAFLDRGGANFREAEPALRRSLAAAPPALAQTSSVLADLDSNETALNTLVRSTAGVVNAIDTASPGLGELVDGAATTFAAIGSRAAYLQDTIASAPSALEQTRTTFTHADRTLAAVASLTSRIAPGVDQLEVIAGPLNDALKTVVRIGPDAQSTLSTAGRSAPQISALLATAGPLMPELSSIGRQSATALNCIRPYTPDIVAFIQDWGDFTSPTDGKDHYGRSNTEVLVPAATNDQGDTSAQAVQRFPGLTYAFPRPPGYDAGQPWLLSQCGIGRSALNPVDDPESRSFNPLERLPSGSPVPDSKASAR